MRIFFTGSQGTGKSTLVDMLMNEFPWLERTADITRDLVKDGAIKKEETSKGSNEEVQAIIFNAYLPELRKNDIISPRHLVDAIAYSKWLYDREGLSQEELDREVSITSQEIQNMNLDKLQHKSLADANFIIYTPVEFEPEDDGMRDLDPQYQAEIDECIVWALGAVNANYIQVSGTPEERLQQILKDIYMRIYK